MRTGLACGGVLAVVALAIAGCSGGDGSAVEELLAEVAPVAEADIPAATAAAPKSEGQKGVGKATAVPPVIVAEEPTSDPNEEFRARLRENKRQATMTDPAWGLRDVLERTPSPREMIATPTPPPLPSVEFPDDVALVGRAVPRFAYPYHGPQSELLRIYRHKGELVRETLFLPPFPQRELRYEDVEIYSDYVPPLDIPDGPEIWHTEHIAAPNVSSIIMTVCVVWACSPGHEYTEETPGSTALYESRDGGITWAHLALFDMPWRAVHVLPSEDGQTRLLLRAAYPFFQDKEGLYSQWPDDHFMLWPILSKDGPGRKGMVPERYYDISCGPGRCPGIPLSDELLLDIGYYKPEELQGGAAIGDLDPLFKSFGKWLTIRNSSTLEQWPVRLPDDVIGSALHFITPLAIQQGPFLRVADDLGDCLPVLADPSPDAEELACMAARVLLTDLAEAEEIEGAIWHRVRTPAGIEGWADGRNLE